jgi:hypothetical protein
MRNYLKTALVTGILIIATNFIKAQETTVPTMPIDNETKLISFTAVKEIKGVSKDELYKRSLKWFNTYYKNPKDVIREQDSVEGKIVGKARFMIYSDLKSSPKIEGGLVMYTITVSAREGRYKYEITAFNWKQNSYYAAEKWMDTKSPSYLKVYDSYLSQTNDYVNDTVTKLIASMMQSTQVKSTKDNW